MFSRKANPVPPDPKDMFDGAVESAKEMARMQAAHYNTLIEGGVPKADAIEFTQEFMREQMNLVQESIRFRREALAQQAEEAIKIMAQNMGRKGTNNGA